MQNNACCLAVVVNNRHELLHRPVALVRGFLSFDIPKNVLIPEPCYTISVRSFFPLHDFALYSKDESAFWRTIAAVAEHRLAATPHRRFTLYVS